MIRSLINLGSTAIKGTSLATACTINSVTNELENTFKDVANSYNTTDIDSSVDLNPERKLAEQFTNLSLRLNELRLQELNNIHKDKPMKTMKTANTINIAYADLNGYEQLSNFALIPFTVYGQTFKSVEHAFQWAKVKVACIQPNKEDLLSELLNVSTASQARYLGRKAPLDKDLLKQWNIHKSEIMKEILEAKFEEHSFLKDLLLSTDNKVLTHYIPNGNRQDYWTNKFPELLMEIRNSYK